MTKLYHLILIYKFFRIFFTLFLIFFSTTNDIYLLFVGSAMIAGSVGVASELFVRCNLPTIKTVEFLS